MTVRKTVGWLVFAALIGVLLFQTPRIAAEACYHAGSSFYAAGKYQAAANAYKTAVFLDRRFARGYTDLGSSYLALEKYALAEQAFLKAKSINDDSCAACGLGMTYVAFRRHDDAEKEFKRAITLNPSDVCGHEQSGRMYYNLGRYQEAITAFKRVITLRPFHGTYVYLGNAYVYRREYEQGVDAYKKAIQLNPKYVRAHLQLGVAYDYLRRYGDAAHAYKQALKLDPDDVYARYALALVYLSLHNKPAALEQYEMLRKINPEHAAALIAEMNVTENRVRGKEKLYFIPMGDFSAASLTKLVNYCKEKTGIQATVTEPLAFALSTIDKRRQQVIAEDAVELMKQKYPKLTADPNAILIGITDEDMYILNEDWQYAFSYSTQTRFAIVSSARMNPTSVGGAANDVLTESRMRKMVLKKIGVLFYLHPTNYDPKSVLYDSVQRAEDLDNMDEDF